MSAQARATQTSRHIQRQDLSLTPASVHNLPTKKRVNDGNQDGISLFLFLNTLDLEINDDLDVETTC